MFRHWFDFLRSFGAFSQKRFMTFNKH